MQGIVKNTENKGKKIYIISQKNLNKILKKRFVFLQKRVRFNHEQTGGSKNDSRYKKTYL
jgi:hypothetical protein